MKTIQDWKDEALSFLCYCPKPTQYIVYQECMSIAEDLELREAMILECGSVKHYSEVLWSFVSYLYRP